jgi:hypothetical protein
MGTAIDGADARNACGGSQQLLRFHDLALARQPLGLNRIEPGTLAGQQGTAEAHALAALLDVALVLAHPGPGAHELALMPGGIVLDQQDGALAAPLRLGDAPREEVNGHGADGTASDEAQPQLCGALPRGLPPPGQEALAGHGLGGGVVARERLVEQTQGVVLILPGAQGGMGQATPPDLVRAAQQPGGEAQQPGGVELRPPDQTLAPRFFARILRVGTADPLLSLARRQRTPLRAKVVRRVTPLTRWAVRPCS